MFDWTRHKGLRAALAAVSVLAMAAACSTSAEKPATEAAAAASKPADNPAWPQKAVADPTSLGFTAEGLAALDAGMAKVVADQRAAGVVTLLARHGEVAQFKTYGVQSGDPKTGTPMAKDTMFRIYSMTKPVTGVAMMQLYEQGKWRLDDPVSKYIPEFDHLKRLSFKDGKLEMKDGQPVLIDATRSPTMRELMSHTAGLAYGLCCTSEKEQNYNPADEAFLKQNVLASANLNEMMTKIADIPLIFDPGTRWSYSASVDVQGYLVEKLSGQKFGDYLKEHIFTPLGMTETAFYVPQEKKARLADMYHRENDKLVVNPQDPNFPKFIDPYGYFNPSRMEGGGAGLASTIHDYARFCQMLLNKGELAGKRLLKPESVALMAQNQIGELDMYWTIAADDTAVPGQKFGLDFAIYDDPAAGKYPYSKGTYYWSGAAGTWFWIDPVNDLFFVGMIQVIDSGLNTVDLSRESSKLVYAALTGADAATPAGAKGAQ